jgi:nitrogen regulatory protein P-II 1
VQAVLDTAKKVCRTGKVGDGKIFVYELANAVRIRTGEEGPDAIKDPKDMPK